MKRRPKVLLVDDQATEIEWLIRRLHKRGYEVMLAANGREAESELKALAAGSVDYQAGIFDIMVAVDDLAHLIELGDEVDLDGIFEQSADTGIRLCELARSQLGLSEQAFPIAAISVRDDDHVQEALKSCGVELFKRDAPSSRSKHSIMMFLDEHLPKIDLNN